jgi:hypothetical protein
MRLEVGGSKELEFCENNELIWFDFGFNLRGGDPPASF